MGGDRKPEFFAGKDIKIGIIGCGYVGLPLALRFAEVGQRVTGFDTDPQSREAECRPDLHPAHSRRQNSAHVDAKHFNATTDFTRFAKWTPC